MRNRQFQVVGNNPGYVMGPYVMGAYALAAAAPPHVVHWPGGAPQQPSWRGGEVAPGVQMPDEGMVPVPLTPSNGTGIFGAATGTLAFNAQVQKPFRAERLITSVVRTGASAVGLVLGQIFVGTDLEQGTLGNLALEAIGNPNAFGTRLTLRQAPPGVVISINTLISPAPTGGDTVFVNLMFLGRIVH